MDSCRKGDSADTQNLVKEIANLRLKKAQLLGKKSFAEWKLQDQMAQTPTNAMDLMHKIATPAIEGAKKEKTEYRNLSTPKTKILKYNLGIGISMPSKSEKKNLTLTKMK